MRLFADQVPSPKNLKVVRAEFNPSNLSQVDQIKITGAEFLDLVDEYGVDPRLTALARTAMEEAVMWAVKSVTAD